MQRVSLVVTTLALSLTAGVLAAQTISASAPAATATAQATVAQSFQAQANMYSQAATTNRQLASAVASALSNPTGGQATSSAPKSGGTSTPAAISAAQYNKIAALDDTLAANAQKLADFHTQLSARLNVEQGTAQ